MTIRLGPCANPACHRDVLPGEPFDLQRYHQAADFPGDVRRDYWLFWHRGCNPNADHSKDDRP